MNTGTPASRWSPSGTNALARRISQDVLTAIQKYHARHGGPTPMKTLLENDSLKFAMDNVRRTAGVNGYPYNREILSEALQHLRKSRDIKSTHEGWIPTGTTVEPTGTLTVQEFKYLKSVLKDDLDLMDRVLKAVRYRKE